MSNRETRFKAGGRPSLGIRSALAAWMLIALTTVAPCRADDRQALLDDIDAALERATAFLLARQSDDGAWRSSTYGIFKDGPSLTPHVLTTVMVLAPQTSQTQRGLAYLQSLEVTPENRDGRLINPVYTAAGATWIMALGAREPARRDACLQAMDRYLAVVRAHQLTPANGWRSDDPQFGAWGYAIRQPVRPESDQAAERIDANLSATLYGLGALRLAGVAEPAPYRQALHFVQRCQNFTPGPRNSPRNTPRKAADAPHLSDPPFDDGGFFFSPTDPARNKAGVAGIDTQGRQRYHSYGSTTADGVRALLVCGLPRDHPRVVAAARWLERHFDPASVPGAFEADREVLRDGFYFYYAWSVSHALRRLELRRLDTAKGSVDWPTALARELLRRQRADGAWVNRFTDGREDDPLIATPFAAAALALCREAMVTD